MPALMAHIVGASHLPESSPRMPQQHPVHEQGDRWRFHVCLISALTRRPRPYVAAPRAFRLRPINWRSFYRGKFNYCTDGSVSGLSTCVATYVTGENVLSPRSWVNPRKTYDSVPKGMLTLSEVASGSDWATIMYYSMDITGMGCAWVGGVAFLAFRTASKGGVSVSFPFRGVRSTSRSTNSFHRCTFGHHRHEHHRVAPTFGGRQGAVFAP